MHPSFVRSFEKHALKLVKEKHVEYIFKHSKVVITNRRIADTSSTINPTASGTVMIILHQKTTSNSIYISEFK